MVARNATGPGKSGMQKKIRQLLDHDRELLGANAYGIAIQKFRDYFGPDSIRSSPAIAGDTPAG